MNLLFPFLVYLHRIVYNHNRQTTRGRVDLKGEGCDDYGVGYLSFSYLCLTIGALSETIDCVKS